MNKFNLLGRFSYISGSTKPLLLVFCVLLSSLLAKAQFPIVTSFTPTSGGINTTVTITGTNFAGTTAVSFGQAPALSFSVVNATTINAVVGTGGSGPISITNAIATNTSGTFFNYINAAPTIISISPTTSTIGGSFTITGTNFSNTSGTAVFIGGLKATVSAANTTSITCTIPNGAVSDYLTVVNISSGRLVRTAQPFRITHSAGMVTATTFGVRTAVANAGINGPVRLRMADMDNDGKADAVFTRTSGNLGILRNTSTASVASFANPVDANNRTSTYFDIADITTDGKLDIMESNGTTTFFTRANNSTSGSISIGAGNAHTIGGAPSYLFRGIAAADLDADGMIDVTAAASYPNAGWFFGRMATHAGTSFFNAGTNASGLNDHYQVATGDLNADNQPDIVSLSSADFTMVANVNKSSATTFTLHYNGFATGAGATDGKILIADLNADGKNDVLARTNGDIRVWRNTTATAGSNTLTFNPGQAFAAPITNKTNFAIGDLNGDGLPDLVVCTNSATGTLQVYINTSTSTDISFAAAISINGLAAADVAIADVNNDNRPDIITTETAGNSFGVYLFQATAPTITSFTPASGPVGTSVTITGTNFTGATAVSFNNTAAASYTVNSATQITATVAASSTTGAVRVTTFGGTATSSTNFTVTASIPTITSFTPTTGPAGTVVTIIGTNFTGATLVKINTASASYTVNSATQITATVATGTPIGIGPITVTANGNIATSSTNFTVTAAATPTITGIVGPLSSATNWIVTGGLLTINGTNFTGVTAVTVGTASTPVTSFTVVSATQITCRVAGATATGSGPVQVTAGTTATSSNYTIISGLPVINSFSPASGNAGTTVVINGTNLYIDNGSPNPTVTIGANNTPATFVGYTGNDLSVTVGAGTNTGPINITTTYGTVTSSTNFTVAAAPAITSIDFLTGSIGFFVTVTGSNLMGATAVMANGVAMAVSNNTATSVRLQVPTGGLSGPIQLSANGSTVFTQFFTITTAANVLQHIPGQTLTLTSAVSAATYQWQVSTGNGFVNIANNANYSGATTNRLVVTGMPTSWTGYQYRVVAGSATSTEQTLRFVHTSLGGNWNATNSWHLGSIPDQNGDVFFNPLSPSLNVNVNASCRSLTATNSNVVSVRSGVTLTIHK